MFTVDYYIKKFEAIPEGKWTTKTMGSNGVHCALGHCGAERSIAGIPEAMELNNLFSTSLGCYITTINDYKSSLYPQPTPKQRVIAALCDIKSLQAVKEAEAILSQEQKETICTQ